MRSQVITLYNLDYTSTRYSDIIVKPKNLKSIPLTSRHGPAWRSMIFSAWSKNMKKTLEAQLSQWSPTDSLFREVAFAVLCLASGAKNVAFLPYEHYIEEQGDVNCVSIPNGKPSGDLVMTANGAHSGIFPLVAPVKTVYWLDGVLVHLASKLDQADLVEAQISFMVNYCGQNHGDETVDAILISVEHVLLLRIRPNARVQRSSLLTLFNLPSHCGMDPADRSLNPDLERLGDPDQREQAGNRVEQRPSRTDLSVELDEDLGLLWSTTRMEAEGDPSLTFFALCHVFEAAARRRLPFNDALGFALPNEIILEILSHVTDLETRSNCMKVSRLFRNVCQERYLFADNMLLMPLEGEFFANPNESWHRWNIHDVATKTKSVVNVTWTFFDMEWARRELQYSDWSDWDLQCLSETLASPRSNQSWISLMSDIRCGMIPE